MIRRLCSNPTRHIGTLWKLAAHPRAVSNEVASFETGASTESAHIHRHVKQKITQKNPKEGNNVILLIILYSRGIASKCGFQLCAKRISVCPSIIQLFFSLLLFEWEQIAQWRDYHNIALSGTRRIGETIFGLMWHRCWLPYWKKK